MNSDVRQLLEAVKQGTTSVDEALLELKQAPFVGKVVNKRKCVLRKVVHNI